MQGYGDVDIPPIIYGRVSYCHVNACTSLSDALTGGGDVSCVGQTVKPARRRCSVAVGDGTGTRR